MHVTLLLHILAGGLGLAFGYVALFSAKGAPLHRRSGMLFVYAMLGMCFFGTLITIVKDVEPAVNVPAGVLTAYLVITALITVRPPFPASRWLNPLLMSTAFGVGIPSLAFGFQAVANGGMRDGMPAFPFFMFGVVGTLAGLLDLRMMRAGGLIGPARLARHLWRMSFALFIAALSFFLGQSDEFPAALRILPLLALPVLVVLAMMVYWLWRVRVRGLLRGVIRGTPARAR